MIETLKTARQAEAHATPSIRHVDAILQVLRTMGPVVFGPATAFHRQHSYDAAVKPESPAKKQRSRSHCFTE